MTKANTGGTNLLQITLALLVATVAAEGADNIQSLDLRPVLGQWPFSNLGAEWMLPSGNQVLDGIPFQIDGLLLLNATNSVQRPRPGRLKVEHVAVGRRFEWLHLLCAADSDGKAGLLTGIIRLHFSDDTEAALEIHNGEDVRNWQASWHSGSEQPLENTNSRVAWVGQHSSAAQSDKYFRLYHVTLTNPAPDKLVTELSLESPKTACGLLTAAISVGPANAEPVPDTIKPPAAPFPDLRPRQGEPCAGKGIVRTLGGEQLAGAHVRVMAVRNFTTRDSNSTTDDPTVGTEAVTGEQGQFAMPPLPDNKLYRLMAVAEGFVPESYRGFDPKSDPIEIRLKPLPSSESKSNFAVRAKLVGPDGAPVAWATIEPDGVEQGSGTIWGGSVGFSDQVVSWTNGEFILSRAQPFTRVQTRIHAPGLADRMVWLDATNGLNTVHLGVGAVIQGRVLKDGQPLAVVKLGICGAVRYSEVFAGHYDTTTDYNGQFVFPHVPTNIAWYYYGIMSSFKQYGALAARPVQSGGNGETNDLGDLVVNPGLRLAGQVQTRDGEKLPRGLKVRLGYDTAWDEQSASVGSDGTFAFQGLYTGPLNISLDNRDWRLGSANRSLDLNNPFRMSGLLEDDKTNFVIAIEKGQIQYNFNSTGNGNLPQQDRPESRPLEGAERSGTPPIILAGHVVDDKTGDPIKQYRVIPGYKPPVTSFGRPPPKPLLKQVLEPFARKGVPWNEMPFWEYHRAYDLTNQSFYLEFTRLSSEPMLRVEAVGCEPVEFGPVSTNATNLVIRMSHGAGPSGIVLLPNGSPAAGATVLYMAEHEQCGLTGRNLSNYGSKDSLQTTGADGKFSFPLRAHGLRLYVSHQAGWAEESVERGGSGIKLQLQPWASVGGTLVNSNGTPAAGVDLGLTVPTDWQRGEPGINIQGRTTTDALGNFAFLDVPPLRVEVQRIIPMTGGIGHGWQWRLQTWVLAQPGISNNAGKVIYDQPPPPPVLDQIKQKLGL